MSKHPTIDDAEVADTALKAYKAYLEKNLPLLDPHLRPEQFESEVRAKYGAVMDGQALDGDKPGDREAKIKMHIKTVSSAARALTAQAASRRPDGTLASKLQKLTIDRIPPPTDSVASPISSNQSPDAGNPTQDFFTQTQVLLPYLDSLYGPSIDASDYSIFTELTEKYTKRFFKDVGDLNVLYPDKLTKVTEYGEYIAKYVDKIVKNGFAYETSDGSVYFDIQAFEAAGNHYARLEPWNKNDKSLQADGEGALIQKTTEKRSDADFALWKASKPGEPAWPSPWGKGRPGWHIECSAMASDTLGQQMDIHSGGIDLAFPHHDNELAQSEAFWNGAGEEKKQWVNFFLHMGHLSIQGSKMSKSLKNFTTIREALDRGDWTPRSLRIVFLLGGWREGVEITDDLVKQGSAWEEKVNVRTPFPTFLTWCASVIHGLMPLQNFFMKAIDPSAKTAAANGDSSLAVALKEAQDKVHDALGDSFNTPLAMTAISELITTYNTLENGDIEPTARWITSMVNIFGLNGKEGPDSKTIGWAGVDIPEEAKPYVYPLSSIRDELRQAARFKDALTDDSIQDIIKSKSPPENGTIAVNKYAAVFSRFISEVSALSSSDSLSKDLLSLSDKLRDSYLWDLGIYLEDREGQPALVRPLTKSLIDARDEKVKRAQQKEDEKRRKEEEKRLVQEEKDKKASQSHLEIFKTEEFSEWDDEGMPTKDKEGKEIAKSRVKKLRKDWDRQKRAYEAWKASR